MENDAGGYRILITTILIVFLISFVSAGWLSRITGGATDNQQDMISITLREGSSEIIDFNSEVFTLRFLKLSDDRISINVDGFNEDISQGDYATVGGFKIEVVNVYTSFWTRRVYATLDVSVLENGTGKGEVGVTCTDSDGGMDYYTKGYIVTEEGIRSDDECYSHYSGNENDLLEYYCTGDSLEPALGQVYECPTGCSDGACIGGGKNGGSLNQTVNYEDVLMALNSCKVVSIRTVESNPFATSCNEVCSNSYGSYGGGKTCVAGSVKESYQDRDVLESPNLESTRMISCSEQVELGEINGEFGEYDTWYNAIQCRCC